MCWAETSASVQWVAIRTERMPSATARLSSAIVPTPGSSSEVGTARSIWAQAASIHSQSVWLPAP